MKSTKNLLSYKFFHKSALKGFVTSGACAAIVGCSGGGPSAIEKPSFDPSGSAARAIETYDTDKDGFVAGPELEKSASLNSAIKNIDKDHDGKVSEQEIVDRVSTWADTSIGQTSIYCEVTLDGAPVAGATITFVPEEFMGGVLQEASDVTSLSGGGSPTIPVDKRSSPDVPPGIQLGFYKVAISKKAGTEELIPSKYNTETILGQQVSPDDPVIQNGKVRFTLRSK